MIKSFFAVLAILSSLTGCMTFNSEVLPLDRQTEIAHRETKIDYSCRFLVDGDEVQRVKPMLKERLEGSFKSSGVFSGFVEGQGIADMHLDVVFTENASGAPSMILSLLTVGVIPGYLGFDLGMQFDVSKAGKPVKTYRYSNKVSGWNQIFMALAPGRYPSYEEARSSVMEDMVLRFLLDAQKDGVI